MTDQTPTAPIARWIALTEPYELLDRPLSWQLAGRQETASGYGRRLTSSRKVRILSTGREYRVYVTCYSNAGTAWIRKGGQTYIVRD